MKIRKNILIISSGNVTGLREQLGKYFQVFDATEEDQVVQLLTRVKIAILIIDVANNHFDTVALLLKIRQYAPKARIVITIPADYDEQQLANVCQWGVGKYIKKPFKFKTLLESIIDLLESEQGFKATEIKGINFIDILQIVQMNAKTVLLEVRSTFDEVGKIYVCDGEIIHCELENLQGEEAFYEIIGWDGGEYTLHSYDPQTIPRTITSNATALMIEGMRRKDERKEETQQILLSDLEQEPENLETHPEKESATAQKNFSSHEEQSELYQLLSQQMANMQDIMGLIILDEDMKLLYQYANNLNFDSKNFYRYTLATLELGQKVTRQCNLRTLQDMILQSDSHISYITKIEPMKIIAAVLGEAALNIGLVRIVMKDVFCPPSSVVGENAELN